jgi:Mg2+ and Co2+ transporter CorA
VDPDDSDDDNSSIRTVRSAKSIARKARSMLRRRSKTADAEAVSVVNGKDQPSLTRRFSDALGIGMIRTLQSYQASRNDARTDFMERHSPLTPRNMAVSAEQVSLFLCSDNTVISFFEASAEDVEQPIVKRLGTSGTILRESCDASLLVQAILDAIVDLAIPLVGAYNDVIGDLELDVLINPSVKQSRQLYIVISEINKMLTFLNPIDNLVNMLRDHKSDLGQEEAKKLLQDPGAGVIVTPQTHTYLYVVPSRDGAPSRAMCSH